MNSWLGSAISKKVFRMLWGAVQQLLESYITYVTLIEQKKQQRGKYRPSKHGFPRFQGKFSMFQGRFFHCGKFGGKLCGKHVKKVRKNAENLAGKIAEKHVQTCRNLRGNWSCLVVFLNFAPYRPVLDTQVRKRYRAVGMPEATCGRRETVWKKRAEVKTRFCNPACVGKMFVLNSLEAQNRINL